MDTMMSMAAPPVLQGSSGYYTWQRQLRIYVNEVNPMMWEEITGTALHLANVIDKCLCISLQTTARRAVNVLLQAIAPEIANMICEEQTTNEIWKYLKQHYSKDTIIQPYVPLAKLIHLVQVGSVNEFISNIERIANKRALMRHPINAGTKLGCLLSGNQPHLHLYTAAYKAQWESIALNKTNNATEAPNAELGLELERLFNTAVMGLRNYGESAQLKEREADDATLAACFNAVSGRVPSVMGPDAQEELESYEKRPCTGIVGSGKWRVLTEFIEIGRLEVLRQNLLELVGARSYSGVHWDQ
ncbi:hypothetical protein NDA13_002439 [Ustilago tritici]|nr:hypothetical protein NDA13_002439 [Ustilago tritici]